MLGVGEDSKSETAHWSRQNNDLLSWFCNDRLVYSTVHNISEIYKPVFVIIYCMIVSLLDYVGIFFQISLGAYQRARFS